jgi:hypothetical protein
MKTKIICVLSLVGFAGLAAPVFAGPVGMPRPQNNQQAAAIVNDLEARKDQLSEEAGLRNARGPLRIAYMDRQGQLDDAIARLQSGQPLAMSEIDNVLGPVTR